MSPAQRRDLRVGSRLVLFDFGREELVEINLVLHAFRLSILRRRLYIRPHHRIARALPDVVSSLLVEPLLQQAWQRGRRTSCGPPMGLISGESAISLVL
jgi:hypothetical protein